MGVNVNGWKMENSPEMGFRAGDVLRGTSIATVAKRNSSVIKLQVIFMSTKTVFC